MKTINPDLSRELWKNLKGESQEGWDLVYFIANPLEINLLFSEFKKLFEYKDNWTLRGFTSISADKLKEFYEHYDDLYSILLKMKNGEQVETKKEELLPGIDGVILHHKELEFPIGPEEEKALSDHVVMQYKLLRLGTKAGSKVWAPRNDQSKITKEYGFKEFETEFSTGIDTPAKYVENIDVVWKEQYWIDAAFEIENSTSIYSGLLRFADLKLIAPNSIYPFFIVAPTAKRNRVLEQIKRPAFKELDLQDKVRYLSYEVVNEVDKFFENSNHGLNIDLLLGKSELIR